MNTPNFKAELNELLSKIGYDFDNKDHEEEMTKLVDIMQMYKYIYRVSGFAQAFLYEFHLDILMYFQHNFEKYNFVDFKKFANACQNAYFNQCDYNRLLRVNNESDVQKYVEKNFDEKIANEIYEYITSL